MNEQPLSGSLHTLDLNRHPGELCAGIVALTQENAAYLNTRKAELGDSCKKDWLYHTRHTYGAMSQELQKLPEGEKIISDTMHDFETLYGAVVRQAVEKGREMDFYAV